VLCLSLATPVCTQTVCFLKSRGFPSFFKKKKKIFVGITACRLNCFSVPGSSYSRTRVHGLSTTHCFLRVNRPCCWADTGGRAPKLSCSVGWHEPDEADCREQSWTASQQLQRISFRPRSLRVATLVLGRAATNVNERERKGVLEAMGDGACINCQHLIRGGCVLYDKRGHLGRGPYIRQTWTFGFFLKAVFSL